MCTLALGASDSLPEWTPMLSMPTTSGLMWLDGEGPSGLLRTRGGISASSKRLSGGLRFNG